MKSKGPRGNPGIRSLGFGVGIEIEIEIVSKRSEV